MKERIVKIIFSMLLTQSLLPDSVVLAARYGEPSGKDLRAIIAGASNDYSSSYRTLQGRRVDGKRIHPLVSMQSRTRAGLKEDVQVIEFYLPLLIAAKSKFAHRLATDGLKDALARFGIRAESIGIGANDQSAEVVITTDGNQSRFTYILKRDGDDFKVVKYGWDFLNPDATRVAWGGWGIDRPYASHLSRSLVSRVEKIATLATQEGEEIAEVVSSAPESSQVRSAE